jgi:ribosomal-protein-alanine N-acetyltransferase
MRPNRPCDRGLSTHLGRGGLGGVVLVACTRGPACETPPVAVDFSEFPVLITDRIILRELRKEDAADLLVFRGDAEEQRFNSEPLQNLEQCVALIDEVRGGYDAETGVPWALALKSSGRVVGLFGYHHWDRYHQRADIGYDLARELWGQGLATEALTAAIRFGFSDMQLNRIEAETIADNEPSTRLLGRLGFALEGTRRSYWNDDGTFHDGAIYGLLHDR